MVKFSTPCFITVFLFCLVRSLFICQFYCWCPLYDSLVYTSSVSLSFFSVKGSLLYPTMVTANTPRKRQPNVLTLRIPSVVITQVTGVEHSGPYPFPPSRSSAPYLPLLPFTQCRKSTKCQSSRISNFSEGTLGGSHPYGTVLGKTLYSLQECDLYWSMSSHEKVGTTRIVSKSIDQLYI